MRYVWVGAVLSFALGLGLSGGLIFDQTVQVRYQDNYDAIWSATACQKADLSTMLSWWWRPWLPEHYLLYRPLYTALMWVEARLWGFNFFPYTIVSWAMHSLNCSLLFLLLYSLCPGPRWQRLGAGLLGSLVFNLGRYPPGDWGPEARVAWGTMPFWPAQTEYGSLGFALLALVLLDRGLVHECRRRHEPDLSPDRRWFVAAGVAFACGLMFKETALAVLPVAVAMALYRRVDWRPTGVWWALIGVAYFVMRALVLPRTANPQWQGERSLRYWLQFVHLLSGELTGTGEIWELVTLVTLVPLVIILWRKRVPALYIGLTCVVWPFIWAGILTGNPLLATIKREMTILARFAGVYGGLALALLSARREPLLILIGGLAVVAAGSVGHFGPHYWYWPVALWALIDGAALNALANSLRGWRQAERARRAGHAEADAPDSSAT